jgi:hypothetical protein
MRVLAAYLDVIDTDYKRVLAKRGNGGGYSFYCHTTATGCIFELKTSTDTIECKLPMVTGRWYHLVGTYDGATARGYRDGMEVCSNVKALTSARSKGR